jgi:RNA polymerase sigma-70 factor (family 1)
MDFGSFYIQWFSRAKHFAQEYVVSEEDAENIVQDIFIALYERRDLLNENLNVVAYLFTSIKNACLDFLKKKIQEKEVYQQMQDEMSMTMKLKLDSLDALNVNFPNEKSIEDLLHEALDKLPERCRLIFVMNKLEGKKQNDIAKELNVSINTVESQMAIAHKKLREELKNCLPLLLFLFSSL